MGPDLSARRRMFHRRQVIQDLRYVGRSPLLFCEPIRKIRALCVVGRADETTRTRGEAFSGDLATSSLLQTGHTLPNSYLHGSRIFPGRLEKHPRCVFPGKRVPSPH